MVTKETTIFTMTAESLCSKWGFSDGDSLEDWWFDNCDENYRPTHFFHDLLFYLVKKYLIPEIEKANHVVVLTRIHTIHNPVRIDVLNGSPVDHTDWKKKYFDPDITVSISKRQIERAVIEMKEEKTDE